MRLRVMKRVCLDVKGGARRSVCAGCVCLSKRVLELAAIVITRASPHDCT